MPIHLCNSLSVFNFPSQILQSRLPQTSISEQPISNPSFPITEPSKTQYFFPNPPLLKRTHVPFSSTDDRIDEISKPHELELLGKPSPILVETSPPAAEEEVQEPPRPEIDEALAPFLKFFKPTESSEAEVAAAAMEDGGLRVIEEEKELKEEVKMEYYEPEPGDFVVGVVVSGNENRLDVNVGADLLGTMLTKEVLPLYDEEMSHLLCDLGKDAEEFLGRPVVETGTVVFAEVLGRTLSGRPLLSTRRLFRRVAWHRGRQISQLNEPIEVRISEWDTGGLLTRIEGLRAFLPKAELMGRVNTFTDLKENAGCRLSVMISRIDEAKNDLIISEREAWTYGLVSFQWRCN
ncbi:hypothetical protein AAC387_Pa02g3177 [Persea americana]